MPAHVGITNKFGLTSPTGAFAHETRKKGAVEFVYTKNESGVTVEVDGLPYTKHDITMRGTGNADFSIVIAGTTAPGALKILSVKEDQANKGKPSFEVSAESYVNAA
jgi:hypothetical protein